MDQRTGFVEQLSAQIVEWDKQIERLKEHAEAATAEGRFDYSQTIAALRLKRDQAAEKLQGLSMASDDEWEDMKVGAEQIWSEVKVFFRDAIKKTK